MSVLSSSHINQSPAISIIIPVYNVEKWIVRAVQSLQSQTFTDFEIFLVDDGSTDTSGALCDQLAEKDSRIKVVHQANAGAAAARNTAIKQATGEYLYFMDGDDWCEETMLSDLYSLASSYKLDLVVTGFFIDTYYSDTEFYRETRDVNNHIYTSQTEFRCNAHKLFDAQLLYAPWNKLYRREYLAENNILFPATFWDDLPFNLDVIRNVERVGTLDGHYYHFLRARAESENTKYRADMYEKREEEHQWLCDLYEKWTQETPALIKKEKEITEFLSRRYAERLIGCVENVTNKNCTLSEEEKLAAIKQMINTPQAHKAFAKAKPTSAMMWVMFRPYKVKSSHLAKMESEVISHVKQNNTNLFARLKANR